MIHHHQPHGRRRDNRRPPDPTAVRVQALIQTIEKEKAGRRRKKLLHVLRTGLIVLLWRKHGLEHQDAEKA